MKPKDYNKLNQKKYIVTKLNKYCPKCEQILLVSDYQTKCPICKTILEFCSQPTTNQPKCPTCGSTKVQKISTTSKVVGATLFGLLSKTARSQFKCGNCGYKW